MKKNYETNLTRTIYSIVLGGSLLVGAIHLNRSAQETPPPTYHPPTKQLITPCYQRPAFDPDCMHQPQLIMPPRPDLTDRF